MLDFAYSTEATVNASPEKIFDIVSDPSRHVELAGSDEVKKVTITPQGAIGLGTKIAAAEVVVIGGDSMDLTAESVVVTYDRPKSFSFVTNPALPETVRRMQWWFRLAPDGQGTKVTHEVDLEWGDIQTEMLQGLRDNYEQVRAGYVRDGMKKTLENLKRMAEGYGSVFPQSAEHYRQGRLNA